MQGLKSNLEKLYKEWIDDSQIVLKLGNRCWDINIKRIGSSCILGRGWSKFVLDTEMVVGDLLVLYKESCLCTKVLRVCIFKSFILMAANVGGVFYSTYIFSW